MLNLSNFVTLDGTKKWNWNHSIDRAARVFSSAWGLSFNAPGSATFKCPTFTTSDVHRATIEAAFLATLNFQ